MNKIRTYLLSENTFGFLIAALLISLPLTYAYSTTILIVLLACSVFSIFFHKIEFNKEHLIPISFFILIILSLTWTIDSDKSYRGIERQLPLLLIPLIYIFMPAIRREIMIRIFYAFAVALAIFASFFIVNASILYFNNRDINVFFYHNILLPLGLNAIYLSTMTSLSLLFMIFYSKRRFFDWIITGILFLFLLLLSSKNLIVITIFSVMIGLILTRKKKIKSILFTASILIVVLLTIFLSPLKNRLEQELTSNIKEVLTCEEFNRVYPWTGTTIRIFQARIGYELLNEKNAFLFGFGINASKDKIIEKQNHYNLYYGYNEYNFHNQYIQSFVELGALGFLFIIIFLIAIIKGFINQKELMSLLFFIVMLSVFMTESYLWRQRGLFHFLIIYGLLIKIRPMIQNKI